MKAGVAAIVRDSGIALIARRRATALLTIVKDSLAVRKNLDTLATLADIVTGSDNVLLAKYTLTTESAIC